MIPNTLPRSLVDNPLLSQWIAFDDGRVSVATGKVELGQGVLTALTQIAADELVVDLRRVRISSGRTGTTPDELYTAGSQSIEVSGAAIRLVCAEIRETLLALAAAELGVAPRRCRIEDGRVLVDEEQTEIDYWSRADGLDLGRQCRGTAQPRHAAELRFVGREVPRVDLPEKIFGGGFIHDIVLHGMRHARVLRGPVRGARLTRLNEERVLRAAKVEIIRIGDFTAFVADRERDAELALHAARLDAAWDIDFPGQSGEYADWLTRQPTIDRTIQEGSMRSSDGEIMTARFSRPYLFHASIGPACGLARWDGRKLEIWSHSQGVNHLRRAIATALELEAEQVAVTHSHGAGCYGHNGADDAAFDAALLAMGFPNVPIRVQWTREDEFSAAPVGAAMVVEASASLGADGLPASWKLEIWSGSHGQRPGMGGRVNLLGADELVGQRNDAPAADVPDAAGGGATRNAVAPYTLSAQTIVHHLVQRPALHCSALRGLGTQVNVLAIEGTIEELAEKAGIDPVEYRLRLLRDDRARRVVAKTAELCGWSSRGAAGSGTGLGLAYSRYKNHAAHVGLAARVEVEHEVRLSDVWCVADAGLVINPDGARNQIEGGIVQAASWTLKEAVRLDHKGIASRSWEAYPIFRFSDVPRITVELIGSADHPTLGVGEAAVGPTTAAIANAVAHAMGMRIRSLPLTREQMENALLNA